MSDNENWEYICAYWSEEHGPENGCRCPCHNESEGPIGDGRVNDHGKHVEPPGERLAEVLQLHDALDHGQGTSRSGRNSATAEGSE